MKKCAAISVVLFAALFLFCSCASTGAGSSKSAANTLKVGWAKRSIAMPGPVPITGQFFLRVSQGQYTPVLASVLVLEEKGDAVIFVSCDVVSVQLGVYNRVREWLKKELPGFPVKKLIINATHTHAGPSTNSVSLKYPNKIKVVPSEKVQAFIARQIVDAVKEAWQKRAPGSVAYGYGFATTGHSRRALYLKDMGKSAGTASGITNNGHCIMYGSTGLDEFAGYEAGADPFVNLLYTFDAKGKLNGAVINVPCPSQTSETAWAYNASFWHNVREKLAAKYGDIGVIGQSAAAGDLSPRQLHYKNAERRRYMLKYKDQIAEYIKNPMPRPAIGGVAPAPVSPDSNEVIEIMRAEDIGNRVVAAFDEVLSWAGQEKFSSPGIKHEVHTVKLSRMTFPKALVDVEERKHAASMKEKFMEDGDKWDMLIRNSHLNSRRRRMLSVGKRFELQKKQPFLTTDVHAVRIGNIAFATNRFELYMDYMHRIQGRSPFEQTFIVQLTVDEYGTGSYLATERSEKNKGYGATPYSSLVSHKGGQQLVEATLKALMDIRKDNIKLNKKVVTVPKVKGTPTKADWQKALVLSNFCTTDGLAFQQAATYARVLHDGKNLYFNFDSRMPAAGKKLIIPPAKYSGRDTGAWQYDSIELFLAKGDEAFQFALCPEDCLSDLSYSNQTAQTGSAWNAKGLKWNAKAGKDGWQGFITVPMSELKFSDKNKNGEFLFNIYRTSYCYTGNGSVMKEAGGYLPPMGAAFKILSRFGTLKLEK